MVSYFIERKGKSKVNVSRDLSGLVYSCLSDPFYLLIEAHLPPMFSTTI